MSVIGIDFGNRYSTIAQAKRGGIDIILNENSKRLNSSMVSFQGKERFACEAAVTLERSNYKNTVKLLKRLIGRKFSERIVQDELERFANFKAVALDNDEIGVDVMYNNERRVFTVPQVMGMLLNKLKGIANDANQATPVADAVLSVPPYFTNTQRHAMMDAAQIGGLNVLRLLNEPAAVAMAYGIFKSARGAFDAEEGRNVMFADMGETHFTASVVAFWQGKAKVLSSVSNINVGSRTIDEAIAKWLHEEFKNSTGQECWDKPKSRLKLLAAAEKAKKTLSPEGVPQARVNIECLLGDHDLTANLTEEKFEELAAPIVAQLQAPLTQALELAGIADASALHCVEIVGGGMRSRCVKIKVAELLSVKGKAPNYGLSTTLNMDECIARGCALQCAVLSPQFRISKEFKLADVAAYGIRVSWDQDGTADMEVDDDPAESGDAQNSVVLYKQNDEFPRMRRITFHRRTGFAINAEYEESKSGTQLPEGATRSVGKFVVADPPADSLPEDGSAPKIRVNFNYDMSGLFRVHSAQVFKEIPAEPEVAPPPAPAAAEAKTDADGDVKMDDSAAKDGEAGEAAADKPAGEESKAAAPATAEAAAAAETAEKKKKFKRVNLKVEDGTVGMSAKQMMEAVEAEAQMQQQDRIIREMQAKRNELESYIYDARGALYDLGTYVTPQDSEAISNFLDESENWLYDAFDATKKEYQAKLDEVKGRVEPVKARRDESMNRPAALTNLRSVCDDFKRVVNSTEERLAHLTDEDRNQMRTFIKNAESWIDEKLAAQEKLSLTVDPVLTCKSIHDRAAQLRRECNPIANKPKPAPKPEPKPEEAKASPAADAAGAAEGEGAAAGGDAGAGATAGAGAGADADAAAAADATPAEGGEKDMEVDA